VLKTIFTGLDIILPMKGRSMLELKKDEIYVVLGKKMFMIRKYQLV